MTELKVAGCFGEYGCHIYTTIKVSEDYTMNEVVRTLILDRLVKRGA